MYQGTKLNRPVVLGALLLALAAFAPGSTARAYDTKSDRQARVRIDVAPVQLAAGKSASFKIWLNTHSVDLNQDLAKVCVLNDDRGRRYQPTGWQGSGPGGHHRSGVLTFPALAKDARAVTLVIKGVAQVPARSFSWKIEP